MNNQAWKLESFLDSLIVELDKARETLAIKAINKPLTYAVKDLDLELQLFPSFDGKNVKFITAQPGENGASKVAIQLSSITDQQVRQTSKEPISKDDISIENIEDIDDDTKTTLKKMGVSSINDLEKIESKNVDIQKISENRINYQKLSTLLDKAKRNKLPPKIKRASFALTEGKPRIIIEGDFLAVDEQFEPVAVVDGQLAKIMNCTPSTIEVQFEKSQLSNHKNELILALDPYAIIRMNFNPKQ